MNQRLVWVIFVKVRMKAVTIGRPLILNTDVVNNGPTCPFVFWGWLDLLNVASADGEEFNYNSISEKLTKCL